MLLLKFQTIFAAAQYIPLKTTNLMGQRTSFREEFGPIFLIGCVILVMAIIITVLPYLIFCCTKLYNGTVNKFTHMFYNLENRNKAADFKAREIEIDDDIEV